MPLLGRVWKLENVDLARGSRLQSKGFSGLYMRLACLLLPVHHEGLAFLCHAFPWYFAEVQGAKQPWTEPSETMSQNKNPKNHKAKTSPFDNLSWVFVIGTRKLTALFANVHGIRFKFPNQRSPGLLISQHATSNNIAYLSLQTYKIGIY